MKTLLRNNGSTLTAKLAKLSPGKEEIVSYQNIPKDISPYKLILLSGSSTHPVFGNEDLFSAEITLINRCDVPIIGICLGHELIAHTFGAKLSHLGKSHVGMTEVNVTQEHPMFMGRTSFTVFHNHRYGVTEPGNELTELARTEHSIAILKHKQREIYGFQFHPEHHTDQQFGDEVFIKLFDVLTSE